jgi:two-component system alkaline phosphatase synthesis response regulator PhoP
MPNILLITNSTDYFPEIKQRLTRNGSSFAVIRNGANITDEILGQHVKLVIVDINNPLELAWDEPLWSELRELKKSYKFSIVTLIPGELMDRLDSRNEISDFMAKPININELDIRIKRLLKQLSSNGNGDIIRCGDLVINQTTCEVTVDGMLVELTFKEYELLKLMAAHKGRVFTREILLDEIWGHDYFGGDRTVDVHIRRLRSKIEIAGHNFIDTVRNIGYKFHNGD